MIIFRVPVLKLHCSLGMKFQKFDLKCDSRTAWHVRKLHFSRSPKRINYRQRVFTWMSTRAYHLISENENRNFRCGSGQ